jgi:hypothetical protein
MREFGLVMDILFAKGLLATFKKRIGSIIMQYSFSLSALIAASKCLDQNKKRLHHTTIDAASLIGSFFNSSYCSFNKT